MATINKQIEERLQCIEARLPNGEIVEIHENVKEIKEILLDPEDGLIVRVNKNTYWRREIDADEFKALVRWKQTISQPFVVAYMTDILDVQSSHKVLDIGMGSGYQSAILSKLSKEVYAVEIIKELAEKTKKVLTDYKNIKIRIGDGYEGWAEYAPYDRIMVAAKVNKIPKKMLNQLVDGGKMIIPLVTEKREKLVLVTKTNTSYKQESLIGVRFVPLVEKE